MYIFLTHETLDAIANYYFIFIEKHNMILCIYCLQSSKISRVARTKYSLNSQFLFSNYDIFYYQPTIKERYQWKIFFVIKSA